MSDYMLPAFRQRLAELDAYRATVARDRDNMIRQAHADGVTIAELSRATGLTRTMLYRILDANTTKESPNA